MNSYEKRQAERVNEKIYNQKQSSTISNSLLVAGIGFMATALIGFLFSWMLKENQIVGNSLYYISAPLIFVSFILSIVWSFRVEKASNFFMFLVITIYCISNGIGFGSLFLALGMDQVMIAFGLTGAIFLGTFVISKIMSYKVALGLGKILFIATIVYIIVSLIISLASFFWIGISDTTYFTILIISTLVGGLLSVGYLAYTLWTIQNMDQFLLVDEETKRKYSIFFGFILLINLIGLVWRILQLMLIFGRN